MDKELFWIYEKLGEEVCQLEDIRHLIMQKNFLLGIANKKPYFMLNRNLGLGIDLIIENAIECGSLNSKIWKYFVR